MKRIASLLLARLDRWLIGANGCVQERGEYTIVTFGNGRPRVFRGNKYIATSPDREHAILLVDYLRHKKS